MQPADPRAERLRRLQALTDSELARLGEDDLLIEVLHRVRDLLKVDTGAVLLVDPSGTHLVATAALGLEEETRQGVRIPLGSGFAGRVAAERRAVTILEVDHSNVVNPILPDKGIRSLLGVPLVAGEEVIGVLHVGTLAPREFSPEDTELLQLAADRIALATRSRRTQEERKAATALQRSLLPGQLPDVPGLEFAARYVPGGGGEVGGDWYDVFGLPSGRLCVVVGDVVGRGLAASIAMGRLRDAVRSYALLTDDPADLLHRLDLQVQHFEHDLMATVLCAVVEPGLDSVRVSSAGHPPPVRARADGPAELVEVPADPPIGTNRLRARRSVRIDLPPGSGLVLYTDGLVERRHEDLDVGLGRLLDAVSPGPAEHVCAVVMSRLIGNETAVDDVALLAMMRTSVSAEAALHLVEPAVPQALRTVRLAVRSYLRTVGATVADITDVVLAAGEACANVVEHAYGPDGGTMELLAEVDGRDLTVTVADTGTWRAPRGVNRGRGTPMMHGLVDDVRVVHSPVGTRVVMRRRLGRDPDAGGAR